MERKISIDHSMRVIVALISLLTGGKATVQWGQAASCDADGVISLPRPKLGDAEEISYLLRIALHEVGHYFETDLQALHGLSDSELAVFNSLEDPRMEARQVAKYPGATILLNSGLDSMLQSIAANLKVSQANRSHSLLSSLLFRGYLTVAPHPAMQAHAPGLVSTLEESLSERDLELVRLAIEDLAKCQTSFDAVELARRLTKALTSSNENRDVPDEQKGDAGQQPNGEDQQNEGGDQDQTGSNAGVDQDDEPSEEASMEKLDEESKVESGGESLEGECGGLNDGQSAGKMGDSDGTLGASQQCDANSPGSHDDISLEGSEQTAAEQQGSEGQQDAELELADDGSNAQSVGGQNVQACAISHDDLAAQANLDIGAMLKVAYEQQFGQMDVDDTPANDQSKLTASDADVQAIAKVLQDAGGIEQLLARVETALSLEVGDGDGQKAQVLEEMPPVEYPAADVRNTILPGLVGQLVRVFLRKLQDKRKRPMGYAESGSRVAVSRLWRLKRLGDTNVYRVKKPVSGIDAAVMFLLDRSSSMRESMTDAVTAAVSCTQALERITKVKTAIEMFPGMTSPSGRGVRYEPTLTLQAFGQSARAVKEKMDSVFADGTTPMELALPVSIDMLMKQKVEKRFLIIVGDGQPDDEMQTIAHIARAIALGIEVIGIGMGNSCRMERLTSASVHISGVAELPAALEKLFASSLLERMVA